MSPPAWPLTESGAAPTPPPDFLADDYAAGLASGDSVAANTLVGSYFETFFEDDGHVSIKQVPSTTGVDFDTHAALVLRRAFDTFPSAGLLASYENSYVANTTFGDGGSFFTWANYDQFGNRYDFFREERYGGHNFLSVPGYSPARIESVLLTTWKADLRNEIGGGNTSRIEWNSDGGHFRRCLLPQSGGPFTFYAGQLSMAGTLGGVPEIGSELVYDSVCGPVNAFGDNLYLGHASVVLDQENFGSAQAVGHLEFWARGPTLVDDEALGLLVEGDRVTAAVQFRALNGAVIDAGIIVPAGNVDVDLGDVDVAAGDVNVTAGNVTAGGDMIARSTGLALISFETATIDLATAATHNVAMPLAAGKTFYLRAPIRIDFVTRDAALTTGLTFEVTQNGVTMIGPQALSNTLINSVAVPNSLPSTTGGVALDMTTFVAQLKITTPVAGAGLTSCTGRLVLIGTYE